MFRRQSLIALGVAIVLGLMAVYLANTFLTARQEQVSASPQGTARIAVAAVPLDYGMPITPDKIRFVNFPLEAVPPGSFRTMNELLPSGRPRVALRPMTINEPILASKVFGEGAGASIAALLPDGKRAAAVRINDVSGVAGFIRPNDSVDVLVTRQMQGAGPQGAQVTDMLLQNVRVIAMDQDAKGADGQPVLARTATLEVAPTDAQKLALAQQVGQLSLVLRKPGAEQDNPMIETVSLDDLRYSRYGGASAAPIPQTQARVRVTRAAQPRRRPAPAPALAAPERPRTNNVEVVRGTAGSQYEVGEYGG